MCKVKSGSNLETESDVQNLITGIILRQQQTYRQSDILRAVEYHCDGNRIVSQSKVKEMISDTLRLFFEYRMVDCVDGQYMPRWVASSSLSSASPR